MIVVGIEIKNEKGGSIGQVYPHSRRRMCLKNSDSDIPILNFDKKFQFKLEPDLEIKDERGKVLAILKKKKGWIKKKYIMENSQGSVLLKSETKIDENQEIIEDEKGARIAEIIKKVPSFKELTGGKNEIWTLKIDNPDFDRIMILSFFFSRYAVHNFKKGLLDYVSV